MLWAWKVTKHCTGVFRWLRAWFLRAYLPFQLASHSFWASVHVDAYPAVSLSWWSDGGRRGRRPLKRDPLSSMKTETAGPAGGRAASAAGVFSTCRPVSAVPDATSASLTCPHLPRRRGPIPGMGSGGTLETDRPGAGTEGRHGRAPLRARQGPCWEPNPRGAGRRVG